MSRYIELLQFVGEVVPACLLSWPHVAGCDIDARIEMAFKCSVHYFVVLSLFDL